MSIALHGIGVTKGIAIGQVHVLVRDHLDINEYCVPAAFVEEEVQRLTEATIVARRQLRAIREHIPRTTAADIAAFIDTHLLMLEDAALTQEPARLIRERRCNAEWALSLQRDALVAVFDEMDDPYLRTRKDDVDHVVHRIQRILQKQGPLRHEAPDSRLAGYVIVADDLTPADTVIMQHHGIAAFVTEYGAATSHTAILARSLGIPSIVALHQARRYVREDDVAIVDGGKGVMVLDPDARTLEYYRRLQRKERDDQAELGKFKWAPARTLDGVSVVLQANIELARDFETVLTVGAAGVGLYRTEYLYMNRPEPPAEAEHFEVYAEVLKTLASLPVTIRTLDIGADKDMGVGPRSDRPGAANPALGLRAVRLCLKEPGLFLPQLRAILRASALGPVRLLIPMLASLQELHQVLSIIEGIREELRAASIPYDPSMPIGGMIEVPAAAVCADLFARELDFLSIGTNDLIQYTMAIDRVNDEVSYLYDPVNLGVLRLIKTTIDAAERCRIPVAMCGEMAGDPRYVRLLLGLGLREFSVHPAVLLEVKRIVNSTSLDAVTALATNLVASQSPTEAQELLERINTGVP